ncbi:hypothetical protein GCM10009655_12650 [Rhodoglobus aureus]|uniref:Uncharacterized protein n=1 Tax=Rhodoglobus aureus TaxID=191497 RepID=A0ABP4G5U0_9MICO
MGSGEHQMAFVGGFDSDPHRFEVEELTNKDYVGAAAQAKYVSESPKLTFRPPN